MIDFISNLILKLIPIKSMPYWIALIVILLIICAVALLIEIPKIVGNNIKQKKNLKVHTNYKLNLILEILVDQSWKKFFQHGQMH